MVVTMRSNLTIGLVVYNEHDRLPAWLDHWTQFDYPIIIVDQSSTDGTADLIPEGIDTITTPCRGIAELDRNLLQQCVDGWLLCVDVDEFMDEDRIARMLEIAESQPKVNAWWIRWKNWVDGHDISKIHAHPSDQPGIPGCDWHIRLSKGHVIFYDGTPHKHPEVRCRWAVMDGNEVWVDHRREWKHLKARNRRRNEYLDDRSIQMQEGYIRRVAEMIGEEV